MKKQDDKVSRTKFYRTYVLMDDSECRTNVALDLIVTGQKVVDLLSRNGKMVPGTLRMTHRY